MKHHELSNAIQAMLRQYDSQAFARLARSTPLADMADVLEAHPIAQIAQLLRALDPASRCALFAHFAAPVQDKILSALPADIVVNLFELLASDKRADIFNRLNAEKKELLLPALAKAERDDILNLASFPEGSVGSATTSEYATITSQQTAEQALLSLRQGAPDKETIYVVYVVNEGRQLLGTVSLRELVLARPEMRVDEMMKTNSVFARADWPAAEAAELIRRYDLLAIPVLDQGERMIGIMTVDDAMDIEKEQDATRLSQFGGTASGGGADLSLRDSSIRQLFKVRVLWLIILTGFGIITSTFVSQQADLISEVIILAAFLAPIVDMGGNTGSQSATLVLRAMALGEVRLCWKDVWFVIKREIPVALAIAIVIGILETILAYFSKDAMNFDILMVIGLSMMVCTAAGGIIGALLPFGARLMRADPATLSAPLITSIMDLLGVFIYFGFAYAFLGHLIQ
ncbi:magnesium transporter [Iodobacter sp. LRB]|uniref:magnesium transporter n=1 Tax=unclassified Iodobacter TaxID=235634 RepID=UPI000C0D2B71|nr:magnesium transporter [Iodobacter sp. BJB302]PHV01592.1 magnesium transporter [Iodobacter sp. BJB302]